MKPTLQPNVYVIHTDNRSKLKTLEFSSIQLAQDYVRTLATKEYIILIGNLATEGFKCL